MPEMVNDVSGFRRGAVNYQLAKQVIFISHRHPDPTSSSDKMHKAALSTSCDCRLLG